MNKMEIEDAIEAKEMPEIINKTEEDTENINKSDATDSQNLTENIETSKLKRKKEHESTMSSSKAKDMLEAGPSSKSKVSNKSPKKNKLRHLLCLPGQQICPIDDYIIGGEGTYQQKGYLYASLIGYISVRRHDEYNYVEVVSLGRKTVVPLTGDIVTARVLLVNNRFAKCSILCVGDHILDYPYRAVLRKEEVRATEKDRTEMYKSFRAGDVILARVLPQTELSCYQLTTAENELGVVIAVASENSANPIPMVPIGWTEMQCPNTLVKEFRKVAKVSPESAIYKL